MSAGVEIRSEGGIARLVLRSPGRRNALTREGLAALARAVADPPEASRAIVLGGADGAFSAGADLRELDGTLEDLTFDEAVSAARDAIAASPLVVLAAVDGPCMGAALDLALACDVRIAAADAFFELPAVRLGLLYNPAAIARLHATLPRTALGRLLLLGDRLDAAAAHRAGLVDEVVDGDAAAAAVALAERRACDGEAARATKRLLRELDAGACAPDAWQDVRARLVASPARRAALMDVPSRRAADSREP